MLNFLFKLILTVLIVGALGFYGYMWFIKSDSSAPNLFGLVDRAKQISFQQVSDTLSYQLDRFVTHTDNSPMVMGINITNKSLEAMVDTLGSLPPQDLEMVRRLICQPASPSAQ